MAASKRVYKVEDDGWRIPEALWLRFAPLIPKYVSPDPLRRGRPRADDRVCLDAILKSIERLRADPTESAWARDCIVWLYRGAWQEWEPEEIEMAVPLSPDEVVRKRMAIFKHESQKDRALFPGPTDPREFWQRAEDRNRATAKLYDMLGLAEYEAIEGFVRWKG